MSTPVRVIFLVIARRIAARASPATNPEAASACHRQPAPSPHAAVSPSTASRSEPYCFRPSRSNTRTAPYSTLSSPASSSLRKAWLARWRDARQIADLFLGDGQPHAHARVQQRVEQLGQATRHARVRIQQAVVLGLADELRHALVQLMQQITVERDAGVQQPVERRRRQSRHHRIAQRDDVIFSDFALEQRALTDPAAGRRRSARRPCPRHCPPTLSPGRPARRSRPGRVRPALYDRSGARLLHGKVPLDPRLLLVVEHAEPGRGELQGVG